MLSALSLFYVEFQGDSIGANWCFLSFDSKDPMLIIGEFIFQKIQNHMIGVHQHHRRMDGRIHRLAVAILRST